MLSKVKEVQAKREQRFFGNRHRSALAKEKASIKAEIEDNIELLAPAAVADRNKNLTSVSDRTKQVISSFGKLRMHEPRRSISNYLSIGFCLS